MYNQGQLTAEKVRERKRARKFYCEYCGDAMQGFVYICPECNFTYCLECLKQLLRHNKYCDNCGAEIDGVKLKHS
ncbi:MAG: hypothetical protein ACFFCS_17365 [Candidatus Hodarchaeota archaeon]